MTGGGYIVMALFLLAYAAWIAIDGGANRSTLIMLGVAAAICVVCWLIGLPYGVPAGSGGGYIPHWEW